MSNLSLPKVKAKALSNKPLILAILVLTFILLILIYSINTVNQSSSDNRQFLDETQIENGQFWLVDGAGLALNRDKKQPTTGVIGSSATVNKIFPDVANPHKQYVRHNGSVRVVEVDEQGREFIKNADGTISYIETDEQGRKFTRNADGSISYLSPENIDEFVRNADGSISYVGVNDEGQEFIFNPDGSTSLVEVDDMGRKFVTNPDGSVRYIENGVHERARVLNPDGSVSYITKTATGSVIENPDGTITSIIKGENGEEIVLVTGTPKKGAESVNPSKANSFEYNISDIQSDYILTPEELANLRSQKLQAYIEALNAPVLARKEDVAQSSQNVENQYGMSSNFDALNALANMGIPTESGDYNPAADKDKEDFFNRAKQDESWLSNAIRTAGFDNELKTGTVIHGVMLTSINSDLPGNMIAQVSQNIYDTATGKNVLIPQGSKLFGVFDSRVVYGQKRVLVAWNRIVFPDGSAMTLPAMPGTDMLGNSGFHDEVNNHYFRIFGSAGLMSLIVGGTAYALDLAGSGDDSESSLSSQMTASLAEQIGQTSTSLLEKNLNIKPTLEIRAGYKFNIVLTKDLAFEAPYTSWR